MSTITSKTPLLTPPGHVRDANGRLFEVGGAITLTPVEEPVRQPMVFTPPPRPTPKPSFAGAICCIVIIAAGAIASGATAINAGKNVSDNESLSTTYIVVGSILIVGGGCFGLCTTALAILGYSKKAKEQRSVSSQEA